MNRPRPVTLDAPAKLNLSLLVGERQPAGMHQIESIFCPISLMDEVTCSFRNSEHRTENSFRAEVQFSEQLQGHLLACGFELARLDRSFTSLENIAIRAGIRFFERFLPESGHHLDLKLVKRIPLEAGLGGGSADAAAVLKACRARFGVPENPQELFLLAAELGSDVSAALAGGLLLAQGAGEELSRLVPERRDWPEPHDGPERVDLEIKVSRVQALAELGIVILKPPSGVPTATAYRALDRPQASLVQQPRIGVQPRTAELLRLLGLVLDPTAIGRNNELTSKQAEGISGVPKSVCDLESLVSGFANDFEAVVRATFPQVEEAFALFESVGGSETKLLRPFLAGSGSSVVGFCRSKREAEQVLAKVQQKIAPGWFAVSAQVLE